MDSNLPIPSLDKGSLELTEEYIRLRAYQLFEQRGCQHGRDIEDWLLAEAEIMGMQEAAAVEESRKRKRRAKAA